MEIVHVHEPVARPCRLGTAAGADGTRDGRAAGPDRGPLLPRAAAGASTASRSRRRPGRRVDAGDAGLRAGGGQGEGYPREGGREVASVAGGGPRRKIIADRSTP